MTREAIGCVLLLSAFSFLPVAARGDDDFLRAVEPLITARERAVYSGLRDAADRAAFVASFWEVRDPYPQTPRNEAREQWESRTEEARQRWGGLPDDRARVFLLRGEPTSSLTAECRTGAAYEMWIYEPRFQEKYRTVLVFLRGAAGAPARLWRSGAPGFDPAAFDAAACTGGEAFAREAHWIRWAGKDTYEAIVEHALAPPRPPDWLASFRPGLRFDRSDGAPSFPAGLQVDIAGRRADKTVVRVLLTVPPGALPRPAGAEEGEQEFLLAGQVLASGQPQPVESFLYRFRARPLAGTDGVPAPAAIPLSFERDLRPGRYGLKVRLEHVPTQSVFLGETEVAVPASSLPSAADPARLFAEADSTLAAPRPLLRLVAPPGALLTGRVRFAAQVDAAADAPEAPQTPQTIERVTFSLDGKPLLTRNKPPFEMTVDLGPVPRPQRLTAEGLSAAGEVLARDELAVNAGAQPLSVRIVQPVPGKTHRRSVRAEVDVDAPRGSRVDRVELYLGEERVATLYQPPYVQPLLLPRPGMVDTLRAVAYLRGGGVAEDVVPLNTPTVPDSIDVRLVELFATILDAHGRPVARGLDGQAFQVVEDGVPQSVRRVDPVAETLLRLVTLIDSSGSMIPRMAATRQAAVQFLRATLRPRDEAALITFNRAPRVVVPLTGDLAVLEEGLEGVMADDETALWDSLVYSLYYLARETGQRAVLLLTDGLDRISRLGFEQALECARRAGVMVYPIGIALDGGADSEAAQKLSRLAAATGGRAFFVPSPAELAGVYAQIGSELRAQYRIAYQSTNTTHGGGFRSVQVKVAKSGLEARAISGYYP